MLKPALVLFPHGSVAVRVKLELPLVVGIPPITVAPETSLVKLRPMGSDPTVMPYVAGGENGVTHPPDVASPC